MAITGFALFKRPKLLCSTGHINLPAVSI